MDKLIILGNGFDLAHGLKTSYSSFIHWYLENVFNECCTKQNVYDDPLIIVNPIMVQEGPSLRVAVKKNYFEWFKHLDRSLVIFKSVLFQDIVDHLNYGWVDIENLYFRHLINHYDNIGDLEVLNDSFSHLRDLLVEYLDKVQTQHPITISDEYVNHFIAGKNRPMNICFLNFNYTNTAKIYLDKCKEKTTQQYGPDKQGDFKLINIHGLLNSEKEEAIFGIGDEYHDDYAKLKKESDLSNILRYSKSFWYQRNTNYRFLMTYMNRELRTRDKMQIEIYGHSCGLSDRTLLKYLFEHRNVDNIRLFHHGGKEEYIEKSYEIWRHFDDSQNYRMRFEPFDAKYNMPQA